MDIHVDTVVRLMAVGAATLLLVRLMFGQVRGLLKIALAGILVGSAAYLINSSVFLPIAAEIIPPIDLLSIIIPFWTWLFARTLFERDPKFPLLVIIAATYVLGWGLVHFVPPIKMAGFYMIHIISLILIADLIYTALSGLKDDLIQKRRLIRIYLPVLIGLQAGGVLVYELIFGIAASPPMFVQTANAMLIFTLILFGGLALLVTDPDLLMVTQGHKTIDDRPPLLSPSESVLLDKLNTAMSEGQYRTPGLTIQSLGGLLETPEHRLRALINKKLGHRNFSSFLNGYRIIEAKQKLADRDLVDLPILTIAMDLGYGSLAPFNRAFRAETGVTPSDFRKAAIDQN